MIRNIYINKSGSTNDKKVYSESYFCHYVENILPDNVFVLANSGYALTSKVVLPYSTLDLMDDPNGVRSFYYNEYSSTCMVAEWDLGLLKARMKPLSVGINFSDPVSSVRYIVFSVVLHQLLLNIEDIFKISN